MACLDNFSVNRRNPFISFALRKNYNLWMGYLPVAVIYLWTDII